MELSKHQPVISRREVALGALVCLAVSVAMTWPLVLHLSDKLADNDVGDPFLQAWQLAWGGHSLTNDISSYWEGNAFWPLTNGLAFSDALTGYAPLAMFGAGTVAAVVRYNLLFLFAYSLAGLGAYLLARELRVGVGPAAVAGAIYAWSPWRLTHNAHLNIISSGGIPLSLFLLVRGFRRDDPKLVFAGWAVATWQVSLGFNLGLSFGYLLGIVMLWILTGRAREKKLLADKRVVVATVAGALLFVSWTTFQALPYLTVVEDHPESRRLQEEVTFYSPPAAGFLVAPHQSKVWGHATSERRAELNWSSEQSLWPGGMTLVLAAVGLTYAGFGFKFRAAILFGILLTGVLAMGFRFQDGALYRYVYEYLPGFQGIRTPGRLINIITLGLAVLAAGGAAAFLSSLHSKRSTDWKPWALGIGLTAIILIEGLGTITLWDVPRPPPVMAELEGPQLHLPSDWLVDPTYMFFSIDGWPTIANGHSGFVPFAVTDLRTRASNFPDEGAIAYLRDQGIETVIFHRAYAAGTPWADLDQRPVGPQVSVEDRGSVVVYRILPE